VSPWVLAARDAGATVRFVPLVPEDGALNLDALKPVLSARTKMVAVGLCLECDGDDQSGAQIALSGHTRLARWFSRRGALCAACADRRAIFGCDFLACSRLTSFLDRTWGFCGAASVVRRA